MEAVQRDEDYQCDECDFTGVKSQELKRLWRLFTGDEEYQSDKCNFAEVINK